MRINNLQKKGVLVITCCQNGMRSASAANMLKAKNIDALMAEVGMRCVQWYK